tara:strand:+ start:794 stop:967 length:174 start_codon:yes stop_codon:yes gene_type:complete
MKKFLLVISFFLISCTNNISSNSFDNELDFSKEMSFDEFKSKLEIYAKNKSFPNIDY